MIYTDSLKAELVCKQTTDLSVKEAFMHSVKRLTVILVTVALLISSLPVIAQGTTYTVQPGDNLTKIARKTGTTVTALIDANKGNYPCLANSPPCSLHIGWVLVIPITSASPVLKPTATSIVSSGASGGSGGGGGSGGSVRIGAICRDGWHSSATGRGACSHHGGVDHWLYSNP